MYTIIYIHRNDSNYLDDIFNITTKNNNCRIILIGDESNKKYSTKYGLEFYNINDYMEELKYEHISSNGYDYEKFCFERWVILSNFIKKHSLINKIVYCDSDNALLMNINNINSILDYDLLYLGSINVCVPNVFIAEAELFHIIKDYIKLFYNRTYDEIINSIRKINYYHDNILHYSDMLLISDVIKNINNTDNKIFDIGYKSNKDYKILNIEEASCGTSFIFTSNFEQIKHINPTNLVNIHFNGHNKCYTSNYI